MYDSSQREKLQNIEKFSLYVDFHIEPFKNSGPRISRVKLNSPNHINDRGRILYFEKMSEPIQPCPNFD